MKERIHSTRLSGQIGLLPNHAPIATAPSPRNRSFENTRLNDQWLTMALMDPFSRIGKNEIDSFGGKKGITIIVNHAEKKGSDIDIHKKVSKLLI